MHVLIWVVALKLVLVERKRSKIWELRRHVTPNMGVPPLNLSNFQDHLESFGTLDSKLSKRLQ